MKAASNNAPRHRRANLPRRLLVLTLLASLSLGFAACSGPSPSPVAGQPQDALVAAMLDYIVQTEIEPMIEIIQTGDVPLIAAPPEAFLIIWSPAAMVEGQDPDTWLDTAHPQAVCLYTEGSLAEQGDRLEAIESYRQEYFNRTGPEYPSIFQWGYYEFGILSMSAEKAEAYLSATCGTACGHGGIFTLQKDAGGTWSIVDLKPLWQS